MDCLKGLTPNEAYIGKQADLKYNSRVQKEAQKDRTIQAKSLICCYKK